MCIYVIHNTSVIYYRLLAQAVRECESVQGSIFFFFKCVQGSQFRDQTSALRVCSADMSACECACMRVRRGSTGRECVHAQESTGTRQSYT